MLLHRLTVALVGAALLATPGAVAADAPRTPCSVSNDHDDGSLGGGHFGGDASLDIIDTTVAVGRREVVALLRLATATTGNPMSRRWRLDASVDGTRLAFTVTEHLPDGQRVPEVRAAGRPVPGTFAVAANTFVWRVPLDRLPPPGKQTRWIPLRATTQWLGRTEDTVSGRVPRYPPPGCGARAR